MSAHGLRDSMARQQTLKHRLLHLGGSRVVEEPADERDPQPSAKVAAEHLPDADKDEQKGKEPADVGRDDGRPAHASQDRPHEGPENQGQRVLRMCSRKNLEQVVIVPTTSAAFHGHAVFVGTLL